MFSEGFDTALRKGNPQIKKEYLTLREIGNLTYSYIKSQNLGEAVRPEDHSPKMPNGDIADIPEFPNHGYKPDGIVIAYDIDISRKEIEDNIVNNSLQKASKLFMDFINDFDTSKIYVIDGPLIASECNGLEEDKPPKESVSYAQYKKDRQSLYRKILEIVNEIIKNLKRNI